MKRLIAVFAVAFLATTCSTECAGGAVCGDYNVIGPNVPATPTPTPVIGATPDPCRVESVVVSFHSGAQFPFLALGETHQLDATPFNSSGQVSDGCNVTRAAVWTVLTPTTCTIIGSGFNPFVRGIRIGACMLTATVANVVSAPFSVEVR